jgi:hypothetical protein
MCVLCLLYYLQAAPSTVIAVRTTQACTIPDGIELQLQLNQVRALTSPALIAVVVSSVKLARKLLLRSVRVALVLSFRVAAPPLALISIRVQTQVG